MIYHIYFKTKIIFNGEKGFRKRDEESHIRKKSFPSLRRLIMKHQISHKTSQLNCTQIKCKEKLNEHVMWEQREIKKGSEKHASADGVSFRKLIRSNQGKNNQNGMKPWCISKKHLRNPRLKLHKNRTTEPFKAANTSVNIKKIT